MNIYFYCDTFYNPDLAYHDFIALAEGFKDLGIVCYGDRNMYQHDIGGEYLIKYDPSFSIENADIVSFHFLMFRKSKNRANKIIKEISTKPGRKYVTVFIDAADGLRTPGFYEGPKSCDIVLKSHFNSKYKYPSNFYPWQFGITNRILESVNPLPFKERNNSFLVNFRIKHQLRDYVNYQIKPIVENHLYWDNNTNDIDNVNLSPEDLFHWKQTGGRHYPQYYQLLSSSVMCACYGGVFGIPWGNYNKYTAKIARKINDVIKIYKWDRVRQWDSWRLWESWAAGCCVVHIDFDKYGCQLPVMPKNGEHYIGIDIDNLQKFENYLENISELSKIAENGQKFILEHYSPKAIATRLLDIYNKI